MRYTIQDENGDSVSLESDGGGAVIRTSGGGQFIFTDDEFKEFRRAVGYVWQEVHSDGE
jgi:hypothetical protein